jgi:hypothetical protein
MKPSRATALIGLGLLLGLLIGYLIGWHGGVRELSIRRQQTIENFRRMMIASQIYMMAYSNNPAGVRELLRTNQPVIKP